MRTDGSGRTYELVGRQKITESPTSVENAYELLSPGTWYLDYQRTTKPRKQGMSHAFSFPVCRWFAGKRPPMLPITINTCYPPAWISPKRAFALGRAVRNAIESWDSDLRVAVVTSGGG